MICFTSDKNSIICAKGISFHELGTCLLTCLGTVTYQELA